MIPEIVLAVVILVLLGYIYTLNKSMVAEREKLLKLIMAKNLQEVTDNEVVEKMANEPTETKTPEFTELSPDDDLLFDKSIKDQLTT